MNSVNVTSKCNCSVCYITSKVLCPILQYIEGIHSTISMIWWLSYVMLILGNSDTDNLILGNSDTGNLILGNSDTDNLISSLHFSAPCIWCPAGQGWLYGAASLAWSQGQAALGSCTSPSQPWQVWCSFWPPGGSKGERTTGQSAAAYE